LIGAGFEDSSVKLWRISPGTLHTEHRETDSSKLYIASDYWNIQPEERLVFNRTVTLIAVDIVFCLNGF
jgi:hypothetical protein